MPFVQKFYTKLPSDFKITEVASHVELREMRIFLT